MERISLALFIICFGLTAGYSRFRREIPNGYGVQHPCPGKGHWDAVGHMNGGYTPRKNVFGEDFRDLGKQWTIEVCRKDSDGDGLTNGEELGDPSCKWKPGDPAPGPVRGHPGFCEPDRAKCDSGMTHPECPNPHARAGGAHSTQAKRLPPGANDHPQTFLSKNLQQGGIQPGFGNMGADFVRQVSSSGSAGSGFSGQSAGGQTFRPPFGQPSVPNFGAFPGSGMSGMPSDFRRTESQFLGPMTDPSFPTAGMTDFRMMSPDMGRFRSSLDQRTIQGEGFSGPMSRSDIDRGVQARMDRERSRFGSGTSGFGSTDSSGGSFGSGFTSAPFPAGMGSFSSPFGTDFSFSGGPGMSGSPGMSFGPGPVMSGGFRPF